MTISYSDSYLKLLFRWDGSIWKSIWQDLLIYMSMYYAINLAYRFGNWDDAQKLKFKEVVKYCDTASGYIPLTFLLGFFVSSVVARWWEQCNWISWPDRFMIFVTTYLRGPDYLVFRRTIARWCNLMSVLCWRNLSLRIVKRFPTMEHLVKAGLMNEDELRTYQNTEAPHGKWWLPAIWIANLLSKAHDMRVIDPIQLRELMGELMAYRGGFGTLIIYDWVNIPLVYTQVVAIATYGYFGICLLGRQIHGIDEPDFYVPIFTILQFLFYMGWFKVGEDLMNPFGEDDDDFEMNYILDRNIQVAYMMADDVHGQLPPLQKDLYWGERNPILPHTRASIKKRDNIFAGHLADMKLNDEEMHVITEEEMQIDEEKEAPTRLFRNLVLQFSQRRRQSTVPSQEGSTTNVNAPEMEQLTGEHKEPQHHRADHV